MSTWSLAGLNPYYQSEELIVKELEKIQEEKVDAIYFFGSGVSSDKMVALIRTCLSKRWPKAILQVGHDLEAAAFATGKPGYPHVACILGTGSNACYFDGKSVHDRRPNLGYVLGDEGSGSAIGKILIRDFFYGNMPSNFSTAFEAENELQLSGVLERIYKMDKPNTYLASFAKSLNGFRNDPYVQELLSTVFQSFIDEQVKVIPESRSCPIGFVGSIAFHFQEELILALEKNKLKVGEIVKTPMQGLTQYFLK